MKWDFRKSLPKSIRVSHTGNNRVNNSLNRQNNSSIANFSVLITN